MTQKNNQDSKPAPAQKSQETHFESVRLMPDCVLSFGQSSATQMGLINCSSKKRPSSYSASIGHPAAATIRVKWKGSDGKVKVCRIPWARVIGAYEFSEGDEPAPLK